MQEAAGSLPPPTRQMIEQLLEQLDLAVGTCKLTVYAQDGELRFLFREEKIPATALGRFDSAVGE